MKVYLILEEGLDYNDETYSIGGEGSQILKNGYKTLEEAETAKIEKLGDLLKDFDLMDFDEDPEIASTYCDLVHNTDCTWGTDTWGNLITWAEENNIKWWLAAPQLLQIFEVEV